MSSNEKLNNDHELGKIKEHESIIKSLEQTKERLTQQISQIETERIEYLQNVSHQLVAPLNAIKWHIENLRDGRITDEDRLRKVLRSIYSQATIAVHLAKNFALMSNLEADHNLTVLREPLEPVHLCKLMINLADDFQPLAWDKKIQIAVIEYPLDSAPAALVIKPLISQAFSNIIENAVKYSSSNSTINIDGSYDSKQRTVKIRVRNHGIPLTKEDHDGIFNRSYRGKEAKNLYPAGTGFGLYIAKKIVQIHEGEIYASESTPSETVFTVILHVDKLAGKTRQIDEKDRLDR